MNGNDVSDNYEPNSTGIPQLYQPNISTAVTAPALVTFISALTPDRHYKRPQDNFELNNNKTFARSVMNVYNTENENQSNYFTLENSQICGFLPFCDQTAYSDCYNTTVRYCDACSTSKAAAFALAFILLSLLIVVGNLLVVSVGIRQYKLNKIEICRISLAVADIFSGILFLVTSTYNFSWSINSSPQQIDKQQLAWRSSTPAFFGSYFYLLGYTSSLYHLLYMGLLRIYAIVKPISFKWQSVRAIYLGIALVWLFALVAASLAAWSPKHLTYSYIVPLLLFLPTLEQISTDAFPFVVVIYMVIFLMIPYLVMTLSTLICAVGVLLHHARRSRNLKQSNINENYATKKQTFNGFFTISIMQLGFTMAMAPFLVVVALFYSKYLDCSNYSLPYVTCFYFSVSNSLVNVAVYNIRDSKFRESAKCLLLGCGSPTGTDITSMTSPSTKRKNLFLRQSTSSANVIRHKVTSS